MDVKDLRKNSNLGLKGMTIVGRNELIAFFRNKGLIASELIQPILYIVFVIVGLNQSIGNISYKGRAISYEKYSIVGVLAILIIGQMSQVIYRATVDKRYGLLALKLCSGVQPIFYILGMSIYPVIGLLTQEIVIYIISLFFKIGIPLGKYILVIMVSMIVLLFWNSLGILITMFINDYQTRDIVISFLLTPLGFTAPVFYILDSAPRLVQWFGYLNPLTYQLSALRDVAFGIPNQLSLVLIISLSLIMLFFTSIVIARIDLVLKER